MPDDVRLALVLSGGSALGAYQAGAYEALDARGLLPEWVVGASSGAVNGALIAGNHPEDRLPRLRAYWDSALAPATAWEQLLAPLARRSVRAAGALTTALTGRPQTFAPRASLPWPLYLSGEPPSLYDTQPLAVSVERLTDFDLLNEGPVRLSVNATDMETGEDAVFTTGRDRISPDHLRASSAFPPLYPPIRIGGRLLADAGLSANLPVGVALAAPLSPAMLCLAIDLATPLARPPETIAEAQQRRDDLMLASQSRHAIAAWARRYAEIDTPPVTLIHLIYAAQDDEPAGKLIDYSPGALASRWAAGRAHMHDVLERLAVGDLPTARRGLVVHRVLGGISAQRR